MVIKDYTEDNVLAREVWGLAKVGSDAKIIM
jgi:hypothetical protein